MRVSVNWLKSYVDLPADVTGADLEQALASIQIG